MKFMANNWEALTTLLGLVVISVTSTTTGWLLGSDTWVHA